MTDGAPIRTLKITMSTERRDAFLEAKTIIEEEVDSELTDAQALEYLILHYYQTRTLLEE